MTQYHFRILKCETWWGFGTKAGLRHPWLEHSPRDVREREKPEGTELLLICQVRMYRFDFQVINTYLISCALTGQKSLDIPVTLVSSPF